MSRIVFCEGKQKEFLENAHKESGFDWSKIANICRVTERTLRDWRIGKVYMKYESGLLLSKVSSVSLPEYVNILPDYWSAAKAASAGAKARYRLYGNPGTPEGRSKGGANTQKRFLNNPQAWNRGLFKTTKKIAIPAESSKLAEFIGIVLGDGGITVYQTTISFNSETDRKYSFYVQRLINELFGISSAVKLSRNGIDLEGRIVVSSKRLVEFLLEKGLRIGSKVHQQIDIPEWVKDKEEYKVACIRGLMDTDGSFYAYKHKVSGYFYNDFALCFTNHSEPLLNSFYSILRDMRFNPSRAMWRVYLYRKKDVARYICEIGTNNPKHKEKRESCMGRGTEVVITGRS